VPGVESVQATTPARREGGREFQAQGRAARKEQSPTVFNLKGGRFKIGESDDHKAGVIPKQLS